MRTKPETRYAPDSQTNPATTTPMPRLPSTIALASFYSVLRFSAEPAAPAAKSGSPTPPTTSRSPNGHPGRPAPAAGSRKP